MPSKYDSILPSLKPKPVDDQSYQMKVDQEKIGLTNLGLTTPERLAREYVGLRAERATIDTQMYSTNLRLEAVTQLLVESQEAAADGWGQYGASENTLRLVTGDKIEIRREPYGQVKDKEAFRQWCIANGYESMLQMWPTTMNTVCKERLVNGDPLPDGCEVFAKDKIVYTPMKQEQSCPSKSTI